MSLFDDIMSSYILEDNIGEDDDQQQNQDNNTDTQDNGTDQVEDDNANEDNDTPDDEYQMEDPEANDGEQDQGEDDNQDDTDEYQMNDPEEDNSEETTQNDTDDNQDDTDEYQMNDPEEDNSEDDVVDSDSADSSDPSQKLKDIEKSIFDQLTPEQQKSKATELKNLYIETYDKCQSIIDIVGSIEKAPDQAKIYDYIVKNLFDLQKYIKDYLETLFDSKTYIENMTELQKYLAILDTINNVFNELQKKSEIEAKQ